MSPVAQLVERWALYTEDPGSIPAQAEFFFKFSFGFGLFWLILDQNSNIDANICKVVVNNHTFQQWTSLTYFAQRVQETEIIAWCL